ncbi:MAG TPA: alpha/beta hydrolase [Solirubrobacteraceae bacterium]
MSSLSPVPEGPGSVSGAPDLPEGFADTFEGRYVDTGELRMHAVVGGEGPPLLLVHGWPESWYAWRLLMPALARDFSVVAVDQRGMGLSDKPAGGYDTGTQARDMLAVMEALGHERFAVVGHDTGFTISYALAADHPDRIARAALIEIPGSPGTSPGPPMFVPGPLNARLWHIPFNRMESDLTEKLVSGREDAFFGYEFAIQGSTLPDDVIAYYVGLLSNPESLRGSFGWYRAFDAIIAQDRERKETKLPMPVLGIGGERSYADHVAGALEPVAEHVEGVVVPGAGHFLAEEAPDALLAALTSFLAPYREEAAARPRAIA